MIFEFFGVAGVLAVLASFAYNYFNGERPLRTNPIDLFTEVFFGIYFAHAAFEADGTSERVVMIVITAWTIVVFPMVFFACRRNGFFRSSEVVEDGE